MYIGILWQVKIGDKVGGSFGDTAVALAMAVKKAGLSQELHPKDVRKSSQGKKLAVLQHTKWFPHLYKTHSGSKLLTNPNFRIPVLLAMFGHCWDAFAICMS